MSVFSIADFSEEAPIALGSGKNPMEMVVVDDDIAYVTCYQANQVLKVDLLGKNRIGFNGCGAKRNGYCRIR